MKISTFFKLEGQNKDLTVILTHKLQRSLNGVRKDYS